MLIQKQWLQKICSPRAATFQGNVLIVGRVEQWGTVSLGRDMDTKQWMVLVLLGHSRRAVEMGDMELKKDFGDNIGSPWIKPTAGKAPVKQQRKLNCCLGQQPRETPLMAMMKLLCMGILYTRCTRMGGCAHLSLFGLLLCGRCCLRGPWCWASHFWLPSPSSVLQGSCRSLAGQFHSLNHFGCFFAGCKIKSSY